MRKPGCRPKADYLDSRNVVSRILLPLMQYTQERRVEVCLQALEGLIELETNLDKRLKYTEFVTQYAKLKGSEKAELQHRLAQSRYREAAMGMIQEACEEGIRQGRREALREGLLKAIQFGLELKFGVAGLTLMADIQKIQDVDLLNNIQEALKIANNPDEIRLLWEPPTSH